MPLFLAFKLSTVAKRPVGARRRPLNYIGLTADFLVLFGEDIAVERLVLARVLFELSCVLRDLLLGEGLYVRPNGGELLAVSDLFLGGRYGDLTYQTRVLGTVLLCGVVLRLTAELTRHLVDKFHGFKFTHSVKGLKCRA